MAKATYSCPSCGKTITVEGRNRRDADRRAAWYAEQEKLCRACEQAEFKRAYETEKQAVLASADGLPVLTGGTDKQNDFAAVCRARFLPALEAAADATVEHAERICRNRDDRDQAVAEVREAVSLLVREIRETGDIDFWLDTVGPSGAARADEILLKAFQPRRHDLAPTFMRG
ncbi:hypothetical protein [Amorphus sp. 3PC139-8]|uniref:hypothetical protein n=1 Tax=Amorphus sp. 3PC139-8 TaxID=2735676 RepID=UPI00345DD907